MSKITNISGEFLSTTEKPFIIYNNNDLIFDTPKSSLYTKKKQLISNLNIATIDNQDNKVKSCPRLFINKHPLKLRADILNTPPPIVKSPGVEPLAPIKPRRSIDKNDLKPKKLIFQEQDNHEFKITKSLQCKLNKIIKPINDDDDDLQNNNTIQLSKNSKDNFSIPRLQKKSKSDDKENCIDNYYRTINRDQMNYKIWQKKIKKNTIKNLRV